jgi:hypothetical protein
VRVPKLFTVDIDFDPSEKTASYHTGFGGASQPAGCVDLRS